MLTRRCELGQVLLGIHCGGLLLARQEQQQPSSELGGGTTQHTPESNLASGCKPSISMEEDGGLDAASLAEALQLVLSAFRAMEGLAAQIHSCHRTRRKWELRRCRSKVADPDLDLLIAHLLQIWSICAGAYPQRAGDKALALQARDAVHFMEALQDKLQYGSASNSPMPDSGRQVIQTGVFVGRHKERDDVVHMLIKPCAKVTAPDMMVSIVGTAGIGKTTLTQMVFNDTRVAKHFEVRCWVSVSTGSNTMELTAEILRSAQPPWDISVDKMVDFQMIQSELRRLVTSKRYLIVIDDVCNGMDEIWLDMMPPLQSADIGSRILATSRINTVPHFLGASQLYPVNPLSSDDCWAMLKEHAFPSGRENAYPDLHPIGKQIAVKINGSPLAAKLVGVLLGDTRTKNHWMKIMKTGLQDNAVLPALRLSYKYLPVHLKRCFAYCSLFPQNYKFDPAHLSRLWIAEGFVQPQGTADKRMEDIAREYFGLLLSRSFFQEIKLGSRTYYLMHDLLHDLAKSVAAEDCFHIEDGMNCDIPSTVRHLSVTVKSLIGLTSFPGLEELRTLLIRPSLLSSSSCLQEDFSLNLENILLKCKHLRVLDLSGYNSKELPHCIYDLLHLRYLSINATIQKLPELIGKLLHLQTLCITGK
ncbi:hypothetical protein CFC21_020912 [Triticum aestivum]|uniref:Uncharacterized protein n=2 Tax=Triticum aestivum TaxID=4565 RepID=A0A3B6BXT6_WHEAT|nr:hypothetical protein CFC21_020912 [Triticum aestivum]